MPSKRLLSYLYSDYGMLVVLILLGIIISLATIKTQYPEGGAAGVTLSKDILATGDNNARVLVVARATEGDQAFVDELQERLGTQVVGVVQGDAQDVRKELGRLNHTGNALTIIAANQGTAHWAVLESIDNRFPNLGSPQVMAPRGYRWPTFLNRENLINVANQIVVIAIIAIGMTMVIITAGIDLSVGSLIALSAVLAAWLIKNVFGGFEAGVFGMLVSSLAAIALCGLVGCFTGSMVTGFGIPPFIVTLAMMLVASGAAFMITDGNSINEIPQGFKWLGIQANLGVPNAVVLMIILYIAAHILMEHTALGRYIYAVGGNPEAARLSGVPVKRVLIMVYTICGSLAGLGGIIVASQLQSGDPNYGVLVELMVIAAVVVGGTSLLGGEGKIFGTLIGAFIIAVIQNGMNLMGLKSYPQKVMLGLVILGAVLLDQLKKNAMAKSNH